MNLKTGVSRKQSMPNFPKNKHFLPPDTHTHFEIVLPPYCQRNILQKTNLIHREEISFLAKLFKEENYNHGVLVAFRSALSAFLKKQGTTLSGNCLPNDEKKISVRAYLTKVHSDLWSRHNVAVHGQFTKSWTSKTWIKYKENFNTFISPHASSLPKNWIMLALQQRSIYFTSQLSWKPLSRVDIKLFQYLRSFLRTKYFA